MVYSKLAVPLTLDTVSRFANKCYNVGSFNRHLRAVCLVGVLWSIGLVSLATLIAPSHSTPLSVEGFLVPQTIPSRIASSSAEDVPRRQLREETNSFNFQATTKTAPVCDAIIPEQVDFTLVTQLSVNRLTLMEHQCRRWGPHPISIAVGGKTTSKAVLKVLSSVGCNPDLLTVHIVSDFEDDKDYPVNRLRNAAFAGVKTTHAVYLDADFWPSSSLYDSLTEHNALLASDHKASLVVPAFELRSLCDAAERGCHQVHLSLMPDTKEDLEDLFGLVREEEDETAASSVPPEIRQFDAKGNLDGHSSTRYSEWMTQSVDELLPIECIKSDRYEPYLVVRYCQDLPPFQEAFSGYGKNKITWIHHVRRAGYSLWQVGESFAIHFPHKKSQAFKSWSKTKDKKGRSALEVEQIASEFYSWLEDRVEDETVTPLCPEPEGSVDAVPV